jgi:RNA polymerase sigma-70 factor (ECF subfamily)
MYDIYMDSFSSPEFLKSLKNREASAISALVNKYNKTLYNAAFGMGMNSDQTQEVVQEVWASFFENIENFEGRSHIRTYLFGFLYNKAKEFWRTKKRHSEHEEYDVLVDSQYDGSGHWQAKPVDPEEFAAQTQTIGKIEECMEGLKDIQQKAFHLKEVLGLSGEEICNILDTSHTNLRVLIFRAKQRLRICLEGLVKR